jgi:hypothetical protein
MLFGYWDMGNKATRTWTQAKLRYCSLPDEVCRRFLLFDCRVRQNGTYGKALSTADPIVAPASRRPFLVAVALKLKLKNVLESKA